MVCRQGIYPLLNQLWVFGDKGQRSGFVPGFSLRFAQRIVLAIRTHGLSLP